jgi:hypothetical protein
MRLEGRERQVEDAEKAAECKASAETLILDMQQMAEGKLEIVSGWRQEYDISVCQVIGLIPLADLASTEITCTA